MGKKRKEKKKSRDLAVTMATIENNTIYNATFATKTAWYFWLLKYLLDSDSEPGIHLPLRMCSIWRLLKKMCFIWNFSFHFWGVGRARAT